MDSVVVKSATDGQNGEDEGGWGWGMLQQDRQEDGAPGSKAGLKSGFKCRVESPTDSWTGQWRTRQHSWSRSSAVAHNA